MNSYQSQQVWSDSLTATSNLINKWCENLDISLEAVYLPGMANLVANEGPCSYITPPQRFQ